MKRKNNSKRLSAAMMSAILTLVSSNISSVSYAEEVKISSPVKYLSKADIKGDTNLTLKAEYADMNWYIVGTEKNSNTKNQNTIVMLAESKIGDSIYGTEDTTSEYLNSAVYNYLNVNNPMNDAEKSKIQPVSLSYKKSDGKTGTVADQYLYIPDSDETGLNKPFKVGTGNQYSISIEKWKNQNVYYNKGELLWLRSVYLSGSALSVWADYNRIDRDMMDNSNGTVVPAFNLNLSTVLFASDAASGCVTTEADFDDIMTFRFSDTENKIATSLTVEETEITLSDPADGEYLYVQWREGETEKVKSFALNDATTTFSVSDISDQLINFSDECKIWIEKKDETTRLVYAKVNGIQEESPAVKPKNSYTLVVPSETTVTSAGFTALSGGLKVIDGALVEGKKVKVTATSAHSWKFVGEEVSTTIRYTLVNEERQTSTTFMFSKNDTEIGMAQNIGINVNLTDYEKAATGDYEDTIIFKSIVMDE